MTVEKTILRTDWFSIKEIPSKPVWGMGEKPFYRIDKSRGLNKSGVGLGLSISNDIIRSHGGNISLDKSPLNGLRVKISLPL